MEKTQLTPKVSGTGTSSRQDRPHPAGRIPQPQFSCLCPVFFAFFPAKPRSPR
jgi:hypothetical protein